MSSSPKAGSSESTPSASEVTPIMAGAVRRILDRQQSHSKISAFFDGFRAPLDGLRLFRQFPKLWWYCIVPILINLVITTGILLALFAAVGFALPALHDKFPVGWGWRVAEALCAIGLVLVAVAGAIITWFVIQIVACGYSYGKLAVRVERLLGTPESELQEPSFHLQLVDSLIDISLLLLINIGLLLLNVVPVVGSLVAVCGTMYFTCYILGCEFLDYALIIRGSRRKIRRAYTKQHWPHTVGLGAAVCLFVLIPFVGAVFLTTAVAGAVLLRTRLGPITNVESHDS